MKTPAVLCAGAGIKSEEPMILLIPFSSVPHAMAWSVGWPRSHSRFFTCGKSADCFKKITVFGILLFIAYSPLRCQKEQDSPLPRIRKC